MCLDSHACIQVEIEGYVSLKFVRCIFCTFKINVMMHITLGVVIICG